jgi:hypothetical protein
LFRIAIVTVRDLLTSDELWAEPAEQLLALEMEVKAWSYKRDYLAVG